MGETGKQVLFSLDQFIIMIAWLCAIFAILYLRAYEFVGPAVAAFLILNLAIWVWVHRFVKPVQNNSYRRYLTAQTLFFIVWGPVLIIILSGNRTELIPLWAIILVAFYLGIGVLSARQMIALLKTKSE